MRSALIPSWRTDMSETRLGDWMQTATGRQYWPIDPRPEDVCINDIAHALSLTCRYSGHCREFYSVAQHSVLVAEACPLEHRLWGLLHDASEAYIADIVRPLKPSLLGYKEIEARNMEAICDRFGLPREMPTEVKRIDNAILADEAAQIMAPPPAPWALPEPPLGIAIAPWTPALAKREFLMMFNVMVSG